MSCSLTRPLLCCTQVLNTQTFTSQQAKRTVNIFHKLAWKSQYIIYLIECILCKIQYAGKSGTPFNSRLNNHKKDVNNSKVIPACNQIHGHNSIKHAKFTLIEQLTEISNVSKDILRLRLKRQEDFWIIELETLAPKGLNQELNNICIFSSFNSHLLQLGRKWRHYDVSPNIRRQIKIFCNHFCFLNNTLCNLYNICIIY